MIILNQENEIVQNPDYELGYIIQEEMPITLNWVIDTPEEKEQYVIAEYPNGGKEIGYRVIQMEEGHWEVKDQDGEIVEHFDREIPDGIPHDQPVPDVWQFERYILFTPEELEQNRIAKEEAEAAQVKAEEREVMLDELPDTLASTDDAICQLYEMVLEAQNV